MPACGKAWERLVCDCFRGSIVALGLSVAQMHTAVVTARGKKQAIPAKYRSPRWHEHCFALLQS